ncbi:MAG: hypothetical protein JSR96_04645 [Proteobacteria bacterium]|nr:hypothetical protein [Pseudomonadota bacterium]
MTDLSLILFMITAAALRDAPATLATAPPPVLPALGEPVAVWRSGDKAPPLALWLAVQGADPRLRLTVVAPLDSAGQALSLVRTAGRPARLVIEPGGSGEPYAALTYDQDARMARSLLGEHDPANPMELRR